MTTLLTTIQAVNDTAGMSHLRTGPFGGFRWRFVRLCCAVELLLRWRCPEDASET